MDPNEAAATQQPNETPEVQPQQPQLSEAQEAEFKRLESVVGPEKVEGYRKKALEEAQSAQPQPPTTEALKTETPNETIETQPPAEAADAEESSFSHPLVGELKSAPEKEENPFNLSPEGLMALSHYTGQEIKGKEEADAHFRELKEKLDGYDSVKQKAEQSYQEAELFKNVFDRLPKQVAEIVQAAAENKDWKSVLENVSKESSFDWNKPFEDQNLKSIVEKYLPGKFDQDDLGDLKELQATLEEDGRLSLLKDKYAAEQQTKKPTLDGVVQQSKQMVEAFNASIDKSMDRLYSNLKGLNDESKRAVQKDIGEILTSGPQGILSIYFNPDGTWKETAAFDAYMTKNGMDAINKMVNHFQRSANTDAREKFIEQAPTTPQGGGGGQQAAATTATEEAKKAAKEYISKLGIPTI